MISERNKPITFYPRSLFIETYNKCKCDLHCKSSVSFMNFQTIRAILSKHCHFDAQNHDQNSVKNRFVKVMRRKQMQKKKTLKYTIFCVAIYAEIYCVVDLYNLSLRHFKSVHSREK